MARKAQPSKGRFGCVRECCRRCRRGRNEKNVKHVDASDRWLALRFFLRVLLVIKRIVIRTQSFCFLAQTSRKTSSHRIMWSRERKPCHMFALVWVSCAHLFRLNKIESLLLYVPCIRLHQHRTGPVSCSPDSRKRKIPLRLQTRLRSASQ